MTYSQWEPFALKFHVNLLLNVYGLIKIFFYFVFKSTPGLH